MRNPVPWPRLRRVDPGVGYRESAEPYLAVSRVEIESMLAAYRARSRRQHCLYGALGSSIGIALGIALSLAINAFFGGR